MQNLSYSEIDNVCLKILDGAKKFYPSYYPHCYTLYLTGCRIGELFNYRISINEDFRSVSIKAQKKNYMRVVDNLTRGDVAIISLLVSRQGLTNLNVRGLQRVIKNLMPISNIKCGNKNIGAHIFRHNYIRKLQTSGYSFTAIDNHLGYTSQKSEDTYLAASIYY